MNISTESIQSIAVKGALRLLEDAGSSIQKAVDLLRGTGQSTLAEQVAKAAIPSTGAVREWRNEQAFKMLLPKLLVLASTIDDMSDDQYGDWIDALPKDEFFEFIGVSGTEDSFRSALALAEQAQAQS